MNSQEDRSLGGLTEALGLDAVASAEHPLLGEDIGGCKLVRPIAEGGMGRIYEGLQDKPRRSVAVKVMKPGCVSQESHRRFEREWETLGRLRHPYIAQVYSAGLCVAAGSQLPYIVMEYIVDALPLTQFAKRHNLGIDAKIKLFRKVCKAVAHAHDKGVIHRDLKPSNVLVEPSGTPKVIDFGVARMNDNSTEPVTAITEFGRALGTVQYMSPEQFAGDPSQIDSSADVYALGVILYELLTGEVPYDVRLKPIHEAAKVARLHVPMPPSLFNPGIPPAVERVIETCLRKDRTARFSHAGDVVRALDARRLQKPRVAAPASPPAKPERAAESASPPASAQAPEVLACPHCDRIFHAFASVLGKKIRCRDCRQIFYVPKDTSSVPLAPPASGKGDHAAAVPIAEPCVFEGQDARSCPECGRAFFMKPAFVGKKIRCRGCKALFRVAAADGPNQGTVIPAAALPPVPIPAIVEDIGDVLDELRPGESVAYVVRPRRAAVRRLSGLSDRSPNPFRRPFI